MVRKPWRVRIVDQFVRAFDRPVARLDEAGIAARRTLVRRPEFAAVTRYVMGPVLPSVTITEGQAQVRHGQVGLRIYRPALAAAGASLPMIVFLHGGGWVFGDPEAYDPLCTWVADAAEVMIVSIDYRLAPEYVAPAGLDDAIDATRWIGEHAVELGGDPDRIGIMGDSAGGNLAAVVTQVMRDEHGPTLRHQVLIYPSVDSTCLRRSKILHAHGPILTRRDTDAYFRLYRGAATDRLDPADPRISPLHGDLRGLPPALVQTADLDPLRDEGLAYADKLVESGVDVVVTNYPDAPHGFAGYPAIAPATWAHREQIRREVRRHLVGIAR